jgi:hypothetical protein
MISNDSFIDYIFAMPGISGQAGLSGIHRIDPFFATT